MEPKGEPVVRKEKSVECNYVLAAGEIPPIDPCSGPSLHTGCPAYLPVGNAALLTLISRWIFVCVVLFLGKHNPPASAFCHQIQSQDSHYRVIALLFYAHALKDAPNILCSVFSDGTCPVPDARVIP